MSVAWLHEVCQMKDILAIDAETSRMRADIFTKGFTNAQSWGHARDMLPIANPKVLLTLIHSLDLQPDGPARTSL